MAKSKMRSFLQRLKNLIVGKHRRTIHYADEAGVNELQKLWWLNETNYTIIKRLTIKPQFEIYL